MLSKSIIVVKEHQVVTTHHPPWMRKNITDQHELNVFLTAQPAVGTVLVAKNVFGELNCYNCHYVIKTCDKYEELTYDGMQHGKTHFVVGVHTAKEKNPWARWVDPTDFRPIFAAEIEELGAELQNNLKSVEEYLKTAGT